MDKNGQLRYWTGEVLITPPLETPLAGYFTERRAKGVYDDLYASILVLEKSNSTVVIIACDLCSVPENLAESIRNAVVGKLNIPVCSVVVSATHTHTGPLVGHPECAGYNQEITGRIAEAVGGVTDGMDECSLEYGTGIDDRFAFNRRYLMKDGTVLTNPGANNPDVVKPAGIVDHSVNVVKVVGSDGEVKVLIANCANHADTVDADMISADWPGYLRDKVKESLGDEVAVLVLNGTAGDVNHFDVMNHRIVQNIDEAKRIGTGYGETVLEVCDRTQALLVDSIGVFCESVQVPYRKITEEELSEARKTITELKDDPEARLEGHLEAQDIARGNKAVKLMFARGIARAAENMRDASKTLQMEVVNLGNLAIVCLNGEPFTDIGLAIKDNTIFEHTIVAELVNGGIGYLGTKKAYKQGGYETLSGNRVCDEVEDYIKETADKLMTQARNSIH
ncbi:hypothetical protein ACFL6S_12330 [Candidatus Poribacteria bacterium]